MLASGIPGTAQQAPAGATPPATQGARGGGRGTPPAPVNTLGAGPWDLGAGRGRLHVTLYAKDLDHPWGVAFLPDPSTPLGAGGLTMLVTERPGRLRVIRNGVLDPTPIGPLPADARAQPRRPPRRLAASAFAENHLIYLTYSKPGPEGENSATTAVYRARWDGGSTLADGKDIFVANAYHGGPGTDQSVGPATGSYGSRIAWDKDGLLYVTLGDRNIGKMAQEPGIAQRQDPAAQGRRHRAAGQSVRRQARLPAGDLHARPSQPARPRTFHPVTGELWATEEGPQGGDEMNMIKAGKNYGWPRVSLGRNYDGTSWAKASRAPGLEEPVVFWVPAIAISGLSIYDGDKFPQWKGHAFVGGDARTTPVSS